MTFRAPSLFIGHGSPMNAITDNAFSREWRTIGAALGTPSAILCISAHWETPSAQVCNVAAPETIHDFYGFPKALSEVYYPAAGAPRLAAQICEMTHNEVMETSAWGLDHGAWQVLVHLFPKANIPVTQLSLSQTLSAREHLDLARKLRPLRDEGILILGSGNIVHNLRLAGQHGVTTWASSFDEYVEQAIINSDEDALCEFTRAGESANLAVPTREHYLPLLYVVGTRFEDETPSFHTEGFDWGSISMRSVSYGMAS
jgi:4,5-DOPA dioxygenase extradiol